MADTAKNTHVNPIISQVKLPNDNNIYDVHDQYAVHSADDLDKLGIGNVFNFVGVVDNVAALQAITGMTAGDVYLVSDTKTEYVYAIQEGVGTWHEFGGMHSHNHEATVTGTNQPSAVSVTVAGKTYTADTKKLSASQAAPSLSKSTVLGDGTTVSMSGKGLGTVSTTKLDVSVTPYKGTVVTDVTVGAAADAISALNTATINNPTVTSVSIPQYTFKDETASKATEGTALEASKVSTTNVTATDTSFSVSDGVLIIGNTSRTINNPTVTSVSIPQYTFKNVIASKATAGTALEASKVTTSEVIVATDTKSTVKAVPSVTVTTGSALTGISAALVANSTDTDAISVVTGVAETGLTATINPINISAVTDVTERAITLELGDTGDVTVAIDIKEDDAQFSGSGTAYAQSWQGNVTVQNWSDNDQTVTPNT